MEKKLLNLISSDDLKGAIKYLLEKYVSGNKNRSLKLLNGRLTELDRQNNEGTIGREAYNLEKNKIRAAILDVVDQEDQGVQKPAKSKMMLPLILGLIVGIGIIAALWLNNQNNTASQAGSSTSEVPTISQGKTDPTVKQAEDPIQQVRNALKQGDIELKLNGILLNEVEEYNAGLAYLKRSYEWETDLELGADPDDLSVYDDGSGTIRINVKSISLESDVVVKKQNVKDT